MEEARGEGYCRGFLVELYLGEESLEVSTKNYYFLGGRLSWEAEKINYKHPFLMKLRVKNYGWGEDSFNWGNDFFLSLLLYQTNMLFSFA